MINQTAIYALRAMGFLASKKDDTPVMSSVIAEEMKIPHNFLSKILNRLSQSGLIHSVRGRHGGVALARPAREIHLRDVVDLFMKIDDYKHCFLGLKKCDGNCGLHIRWNIISDQFEKLLNETTIDKML